MQYSDRGERGYTWFFFNPSNEWKVSSAVSLVILAASFGFFIWCTRVSDDMGGDSFAGLVFAIGSTVFMMLAAVSFSLRRRAKRRAIGELNAVLNWHVCFGTIALIMVFLHAFGNYNPRTGTYALYGMIALVISGLIGRTLDRVMPRLIAKAASQALTYQGEDRIESIWNRARGKQTQRSSQAARSRVANMISSAGLDLSNPWDMAYLSKEQVTNGMGRYNGRGYRDDSFSLDTEDDMRAIEEIQRVLQKEIFYRAVVRYWRIFHILLAVVTVGVTLWHIEYAFALIIPAVQKYGITYLFPWP